MVVLAKYVSKNAVIRKYGYVVEVTEFARVNL